MATKKQTETDPILAEAPTVTIAGIVYPIRKLGLPDVFRVARILGRGVSVLGDAGASLSPGQIMQVLVASMTSNEQEVLALIGDLLGVEQKKLRDPDLFPMESIIDVLEALKEHQDLRAFLARLQKLVELLPEAQAQMGTT